MRITVHTQVPYEIRMERGCLDHLGAACAGLFPAGARAAVISDSHVFPLYGKRCLTSLKAAGFLPSSFVFPAGESSKRLTTVGQILGFLAEQGLTRQDFLVALGGGVTGDMAGFAAACYLRGIRFVQVPTSLLAQVDSSVGGKTAVDLPQGKNLAGAFHQPALVLMDPDTLQTLPPVFQTDGMGEVIKYACIRSRSLFDALASQAGPTEELLTRCAEDLVSQCVLIKRHLVEADERDIGQRMLLNFGHTLGHALEKVHGYTGLTHGAAVGIGMVQMARMGEAMELTEPGTAQEIAGLLQAYRLPTEDASPLEEVLAAVSVDKKGAGEKLRIVLLRRLGEGFLYTLPREEFLALCRRTAP